MKPPQLPPSKPELKRQDREDLGPELKRIEKLFQIAEAEAIAITYFPDDESKKQKAKSEANNLVRQIIKKNPTITNEDMQKEISDSLNSLMMADILKTQGGGKLRKTNRRKTNRRKSNNRKKTKKSKRRKHRTRRR